MGNNISVKESDSEEDKNKKIYEHAKKLQIQLKKDLTSKSIGFEEFSEKINKIERFIAYYESKYNIQINTN